MKCPHCQKDIWIKMKNDNGCVKIEPLTREQIIDEAVENGKDESEDI